MDAAWTHFIEAETEIKDVGGRQPPRVEVPCQSKGASELSPLAFGKLPLEFQTQETPGSVSAHAQN